MAPCHHYTGKQGDVLSAAILGENRNGALHDMHLEAAMPSVRPRRIKMCERPYKFLVSRICQLRHYYESTYHNQYKLNHQPFRH